MTPDTRQIPGFTAEQTWALQQLIKQAVQDANEHDRRVERLESCVYGNGKEGLDKCVIKLARDVASLVSVPLISEGQVIGALTATAEQRASLLDIAASGTATACAAARVTWLLLRVDW